MDGESEARGRDPRPDRADPQKALRLGLVYRTDAAERAVVDALLVHAPSCDVASIADAQVVTIPHDRRSWRRLQPHASRLVCAVMRRDGETVLAIDRQSSGAYAFGCFALAVVAAALLLFAFHHLGAAETARTNVASICLALAGLLFLVTTWEFLGGGMIEATLVADTVRAAVERSGGRFDQERETAPRTFRTALLFLAFGATLLTAIIETDPRVLHVDQTAAGIWLVALLLTIGTLIAVFLAAQNQRGFARRLVPALPPMACVIVSLFLCGALLPALMLGDWRGGHVAKRLLEIYGWPHLTAVQLTAARRAELLHSIEYYRVGGALLVAVTLFMAFSFLMLLSYVTRVSYLLLPEYLSLSAEEGLGKVGRGAVAFHRRFRVLLVVIWIALGVLVLMTTFVSAMVLIATIAPSLAPARFASIVENAGALLAIVFRIPLANGIVMMRGVLALIALTAVAAWSAQPLAFWRSLRHEARKLREEHVFSGRAFEAMQRVAAKGKIEALPIAVKESPVPFAFALHGCVRVSTGTLDRLGDAELDAVLAHELSHHLLGHCTRDVRLRWIARLTMLGDSFARTAQHTERQELAADRAAIRRFATDPEALRRAIVRMHNVAAAMAPLLPFGGAAFLGGKLRRILPRHRFRALPFRMQLRLGVRVLIGFYLCGGGSAYWHPDSRSRRKALRSSS